MGNVTLPTPVFFAGGALCLVAGYLVGAVAGPDSPQRTTATVVSFDARTSQLCLKGESVEDEDGVDADGVLCGTWSRTASAVAPKKGDKFRFVALEISRNRGSEKVKDTVLYGTVDE